MPGKALSAASSMTRPHLQTECCRVLCIFRPKCNHNPNPDYCRNL